MLSDPLLTFSRSLKLSLTLKEESPDLTIIYCGLHASLYHANILAHESQVDFIICGDTERTLPKLIETLENGGDPMGISGLAWRKQGVIEASPPDFDLDLDRLPIPYRLSLPTANPDRRQYYNIVSSRGCPGHCTYCVTSSYLNRHSPSRIHRWRSRGSRHVFDEIQFMYDRGVRRFVFTDDNWIGNRETGLERVLELCRLIIDSQMRDISLAAMVRPDSLNPSNKEALLIMKEAGLSALNMGLEAAHPDQLKMYGKKVDLDRVKELIKLLFEMRIMVRCGFIMFFPYSTFDMVRANGRFLEEAGLSYLLNAYFSNLRAQSALRIEKRLQRDGLVIRPTTYRSPGTYQYLDKRIEAFQRFLLPMMLAHRKTFYTMLIAGSEASKQSRNNSDYFDSLTLSLARIGKANADLFDFCIKTFETCSDPGEASGKAYLYSQSWSKVMKTESMFLEKLLCRLQSPVNRN